jgi:hypothetical protein
MPLQDTRLLFPSTPILRTTPISPSLGGLGAEFGIWAKRPIAFLVVSQGDLN